MISRLPSLSNIVLKTALAVTQGRNYRRLIEASKVPRQAQSALLRQILTTNSETTFGKQHGLASVGDMQDFRAAAPIQSYEDLSPFIERQELDGEPCLTIEKPVYYHRTSGTVAAPKDIPITNSGLKSIRAHQHLSAYAQSRGSEIFDGKLFGITGLAVEGKKAGGTPFGSASGLLYQSQPRFVRSRYVLPPVLAAIEDYEARYLAMAIYGLSEPSVSCIATANPSTLTRLLSVINQNSDVIIEAIGSGRFPNSLNAVSPSKLTANSFRAKSLADTLSATGNLSFADIWPGLKGVVTWTGGSCGIPLGKLDRSFPADTKIIELGYMASEVCGTINLDVARNICLPTLLDTVFEFAEREAWEAGSADILSLHELDVGREYYLFVTTISGLYRYDMNDILRVTGKFNETPILEFVQKGKGVTNITGEKLHESQVMEAVVSTLDAQSLDAEFFIMLADQTAAGYRLYVEISSPGSGRGAALARAIESRLRAVNVEYDGKRASGRLAPLDVRGLRAGTGEAYRKERVAGGQRDAQFKYLHLQYAHECAFDLDAYTENQ